MEVWILKVMTIVVWVCINDTFKGRKNRVYIFQIPTLLSFSDSVRLKEGKFPEVFWNGNWAPICGHWFWNNNYGATLFCQKLDSSFTSGIVIRREDKPLESDGLRIGECREQDHWLSCTGGANELDNPSCGGGCSGGSGCSSRCTSGCNSGNNNNVQINY